MIKSAVRVGRPPQISRERILDVARQIPARELTMHAVARRLGVSTPALYRHFESRDELLVALGARLSVKFALRPPDPKNWRAWLLDTGVDFYRFLVDNPVILSTSGWSHAAGMGEALLQAVHETLEGAGFGIVDATEIWALVGGQVYLRARLLHEAPAYGDPAILRSAAERLDLRSRAYVAARGTADPNELLVHSLRWLVSTLPDPA
ncbi:MAG TPA: helix-turn-helix domain-containing protein [Nevskiaceae bacterium]|nr:helix-turn-helix domain-containing protein [Nevskiaceae bacterium]